MRNNLFVLAERELCDHQPVQRGLNTWSYPWEHMKPGNFFFITDTSPEARNRLAAAAVAAGKRLGMKFATGKMQDFHEHLGYWCARIDGCTIAHPEEKLDEMDRYLAGMREREKFDQQRERRSRKRERKSGGAAPLGTFAPTVAQPLEEADYSGWDQPVKPGEEF